MGDFELVEDTLKLIFDLVSKLNNQLRKSEKLKRILEESKEEILAWKSVRRKIKKIVIKQIVKLQKKISKLIRDKALLSKLDELYNYLPGDAQRRFYPDYFNKIKEYLNNLIMINGKKGLLKNEAKKWDLNIDELIKITDKSIIYNKHLIETLQSLHKTITETKKAIIDKRSQLINFTVDLNRALRMHKVNPRSAEVLIDTDFAKNMSIAKKKSGKKSFNIQLDSNVVIPAEVEREMSVFAGPGGNFVPKSTINYFLKAKPEGLGAEIRPINPTEEEKDEIVQVWLIETSQGINASQYNNKNAERKFRESGDVALLVEGLRRRRRPTVIFTDNYSEIGRIAAYFRRINKANIKVFTSRIYSSAA